jgi:hypothetical protein
VTTVHHPSGRRIKVKTLETAAKPSKARQHEHKAFAIVPLQWAAQMSEATHAPEVIISVLLCHLKWQTNSSTFPFPSGVLRRHGIGRRTKYRVLAQMEEAGMIKINQQPGRAPIVTLT